MRVLMYGIGSVGSTMTRMLVERGATIVGAVAASPSKNGKDVGELIGMGALGAQVYTDPDEALALEPDLVVMSIASYMADMLEPVKRCVAAGCNVLSLSEELLYSWETSPKETAEIDELARQHGVTVLCTGHQDGYWVSLVSVLMGTCFSIEEVVGQCSWNVDDFGAELARDQQVGTAPEDFGAWAATSSERPPTFGRTSLHVLAAMAGLDILESTTSTRPDVAEAPVYCKALDQEIPAGKVVGFTDIDEVKTRQEVSLRLEMTGKVYAEDERDSNHWEVRGEPTVRIHSDDLATHFTTCGTLMNRIPQILAAEPGYVTIDKMPQLRFDATKR